MFFCKKHKMKIHLKVGRKIVFIDSSEIQYIQSNNIYCKVFLQTGEEIMCTSTLTKLEESLQNGTCIRTHRCYIVNQTAIQSIDKKNRLVRLRDSQISIPVARRLKHRVLNLD